MLPIRRMSENDPNRSPGLSEALCCRRPPQQGSSGQSVSKFEHPRIERALKIAARSYRHAFAKHENREKSDAELANRDKRGRGEPWQLAAHKLCSPIAMAEVKEWP